MVSSPGGAQRVGRYDLLDVVIGTGGMANVHLGRLRGAAGFSRVVAIKRLHEMFARDPQIVAMLIDEARLASQISHPNVVPVLDVVAEDDELFVVMEYVAGESLAGLLYAAQRSGEGIPLPIVGSVGVGLLYGLHAAHEARGDSGEPLEIVHRDVSPQNVLVGVDGTARVTDFGIAKAAQRAQSTDHGQLKGKLSYMAPEQAGGSAVTRQTDIWAAAVVLWEAVTMRRLFVEDNPGMTFGRIMVGVIPRPSSIVPSLPPALEDVIMRGLERDRSKRFGTAAEMASALQAAVPPVPPTEVGRWTARLASDALTRRSSQVAEVTGGASVGSSPEGPITKTSDGAVAQAAATPEARPSADESPLSVPSRPARSTSRRRPTAFIALALAIAAIGAIALGARAFYGPRRASTPPASPSAAGAPAAAPTEPPVRAATAATGSEAHSAASAAPRASSSSGAKPGRIPPRPRPTADPFTRQY